jgi:hypothetical protein
VTRRKGEITERQIKRQWPHHVALPADALRGAVNSIAIYAFAKELGGAPMPYHLQRDGRDLRVFCFATREAAQTFAERFGGERFVPPGG